MKRAFFAFFPLVLAASMLFAFAASAGVLGDFDGNGSVTSDDAVYLLRYTLFPEYYPISDFADFDHNDSITSDDAVYLLRFTLFPEYYPLTGGDDQIEYAEGLAYEVNDDGVTCTVTGIGTFEGDELNIPPEIDGYRVTGIGSNAFEHCETIVSVTIPDSVFGIGDVAFNNCGNLTSVTISDSVTSIGYYAFHYCSSLTSIIIGNRVTSIGDEAFVACSSLTSVTIPESVTSIGCNAFSYCGLTSIIIPDNSTFIGARAFYGCGSLESIIVPDSVTIIGIDAFTDTALYCDANNWENDVLYIGNHLIKIMLII